MRHLLSIFSATAILLDPAAAAERTPLTTERSQLNPAREARPNIVFFLADDHSWHDYGFAGNEMIKTPAVDSLARESMVFERAFTVEAICAPSRSAVYTGLYPIRNGCYLNHIDTRQGVKTVTHHLPPLGYEVILAGKSHVGPAAHFAWTHHWPPVAAKDHPRPLIPLEKIDAYLSKAKAAGSPPFCMFVTSEYPHGPYVETHPYGKDDIKLAPYQSKPNPGYYGNVDVENRELSQVLASIDRHGLKERTVFIYSADHGHSGGSKFTCYDRGLRVPIIVRHPGVVKPGTSRALVSYTDFLPTFIEIAGGTPPADLDGKSVLPVLRGETDRHHEFVYGLMTNQGRQDKHIFPQRTIRSERYRYIHNFNSLEKIRRDEAAGKAIGPFHRLGAKKHPKQTEEELYDLQNDPYELKNLASDPEHAAVKNKLRMNLGKWMDQQGDFLKFGEGAPVIITKRHRLDESTKFQKVPKNLEGTLPKHPTPHELLE